MADHTKLEALDALLAEKRKHEGYLEKLEDRKAGTPEHVYARLRDEYLTKLTDLQVRASAEAEALTEGLREDEAAVREIEARLATVVEERVEGELRAEVGEFDPKDWAKKLAALNANVSKIEKERDVRMESFERTKALLTEAKGADAVAAVIAPSAPSAPATAATPPRAATPTAGPAVRSTPAAAQVAAQVAAQAAKQAAAASRPTPAPSAPSPPPAAPTPSRGTPATPPTPAKGASMAGAPSFDELAFLNSVVGRSSTPMKTDDMPPPPRPSRPMQEVRDASTTPAKSTVAPQVPPSPAPAPRTSKPVGAEEQDDEPKSAL
ncbi:MAG: hypothetical protein OEW77_01465, partial [Gemmatimonadota bacterium]|nr:hypothetical protein [Gemmatimonadota bacterium]